MSQPQPFESWGIVEVMGHQVYAGRITEQAIGGASFIRVDVPAVGREPEFTKLLSSGSIFAITPTSEDVARRAAAGNQSRPVSVYIQPAPTVPALTASAARVGDSDELQDDYFDEDHRD